MSSWLLGGYCMSSWLLGGNCMSSWLLGGYCMGSCFVALRCKTIHYFVLCSRGCKSVGKVTHEIH